MDFGLSDEEKMILQTPEEYGGANLPAVLNALIGMELGRRWSASTSAAVPTTSSSPVRAEGGITAFLVDRDMGWTERPIPLMSSWEASDMWFDSVRVPA